MKILGLIRIIGAAVSFLALCAEAGPTNREIDEKVKRDDFKDGDRQRSGSGIARLHNEVIALDASLITYLSQVVTSIGNNQAKSLVADLDTPPSACDRQP